MSADTIIFVTVLGLRLLVPLAIPRFPLPAIIAALVLDGVDQGIFAGFTDLDLENYQSYDKALDVYYFTIAYLAMMRNWSNLDAVRIGRFLLYYRLVGSMLFELTELRALLLVFPNTFEYFFIFYHVVALRWDPNRMSRKMLLWAAALIWIVIKLPQEYWVHVAQGDTTDLLLENPPLIGALVLVIALLIGVIWWLVNNKLPPADHALNLEAPDPFPNPRAQEAARSAFTGKVFDRELLEKVVLISLVTIIFSQILPDVEATPIQMAFSVSILIVSNTAVTEWLNRRNGGWKSLVRYFVTTAVLNTGLTITFLWLLPMPALPISLASTLFFLLLITLLITLYDNYRPSYLMRSGQVD